MRLGIEDYILKPFKAEEIQAKVKKILKLDEAPAEAPVSEQAPTRPVGERQEAEYGRSSHQSCHSRPRTSPPGRTRLPETLRIDGQSVPVALGGACEAFHSRPLREMGGAPGRGPRRRTRVGGGWSPLRTRLCGPIP